MGGRGKEGRGEVGGEGKGVEGKGLVEETGAGEARVVSAEGGAEAVPGEC